MTTPSDMSDEELEATLWKIMPIMVQALNILYPMEEIETWTVGEIVTKYRNLYILSGGGS